MMDNIAQQANEMEVLDSIFGDNWKLCLYLENTYSIKLSKDVELWVTLNEFYPSDKPPEYDLWAPKLTKSQRDFVEMAFKEIYETNRGFPVIYQWIEKLKDVVDGKVASPKLDKPKKIKPVKHAEPKHVEDLEIVHGQSITDRKSTFQGHVCKVTDPEQIECLLEKLLENKKIAQAKHNVLAYRIVTNNKLLQDCDDDGESHAGGRLLHLLEILDLKNVAVVVTRWYGGIHLGPDRFKHYNNAGRQALIEAGFIR